MVSFLQDATKSRIYITARVLEEVYKDIRVAPQLQQPTGETLQFSTLTGNERYFYRLDICVRGFWQTGQMVFSDERNLTQTSKDMLTKISQNKKKKRRGYTMSESYKLKMEVLLHW